MSEQRTRWLGWVSGVLDGCGFTIIILGGLGPASIAMGLGLVLIGVAFWWIAK